MKIVKGNKVWVTNEDGAWPQGWAKWDGHGWEAPCGVYYTLEKLRIRLEHYDSIFATFDEYHFGGPGWLRIAEQLIAEQIVGEDT